MNVTLERALYMGMVGEPADRARAYTLFGTRRRASLAPIVLASLLGSCGPNKMRHDARPPITRDRVTLISPRCTAVRSCLVGHVTAAETGFGLSKVTVFIEALDTPAWLVRFTDDQGVFSVEDPPPGRYRIAVYKQSRTAELTSVELGDNGTTILAFSLAPSAAR